MINGVFALPPLFLHTVNHQKLDGGTRRVCDRPLTNLCKQGLAASWGASQQNARGRGGQSKLSKLPWVAHRSLALGERKRKVLLMVGPWPPNKSLPNQKNVRIEVD